MRKQLSIAFALTAISGCANTSGSTSTTCSALSSAAVAPSPDWKGTVFTIVMENHSLDQIWNNTTDAPFINTLIKQNALAAGYHDNYVHPSEPNYFELVAGENFGVLDDDDPISHHLTSQSHIADQLEKAGLSWKTYQESMGTPCNTESVYPYAAKHDPFVFFDDIDGWNGTTFAPSARCTSHVVDYAQLDKDLASGDVPRYVFITPNMIDDMHDGSTADGDKWLAREVPKILASKAFNDGGVLFLTWDEGGGLPQADDPPMIVISPHAKPGFVSHVDYSTSSYLKTVQMILGLQSLPCDSGGNAIQPMSDLFDVPLNGGGDGGTVPAATSGDGGATTVATATGTATAGTATGTTATGTTATGTATTASAATPSAATAPGTAVTPSTVNAASGATTTSGAGASATSTAPGLVAAPSN